jgi:pimeloyl-ACP methyl ester carboxylesterase
VKASRSEFIALNGRRHHVRVWGDAKTPGAPTLFFLHGWGDTSASFQFVVDALAGNFRVIAPDWRGFGLSQWNDGAYFFADYLADLDALLETYSPNTPAKIAAHSLGGIVAALYAGIRPQRVERLANLEGFAPWVLPPAAVPERIEQWLAQRRDDDAAFRVYPSRAEFAAQQQQANPRLTAARASFLAANALVERDGTFQFAADPRHRWLSPVLFPLAEAEACWRRTQARTLWIAASDSPIWRDFCADPAQLSLRRSAFAELEETLIDDSGHNIHHDQPEQLARRLADFFGATA